MRKPKYVNTIIIVAVLITFSVALLLFLAPEIYSENKALGEHPIRYKKTECDFSKVNTTPGIMKKMVQIHSFLDDTLSDDDEVIIEKILVASIKDSTINNLIIKMYSVGLLQNVLARYDEEAHDIRNNKPSNVKFLGIIKQALFDYPDPKSNSVGTTLFNKMFFNKNLSYKAARLYFNSYVLNDTVSLGSNRHRLYHLMVRESNLYDYSNGILKLAQEETNQIRPFTGRNHESRNERLSRFKNHLKSHIQASIGINDKE